MYPVKDLKVYQEEMFGLTSQIRRCAVSIPSNIAEGKGRFNPGDYCRFLSIARGSLFELQTQVAIGKELDYLSEKDFAQIYELTEEIGRMLTAMINKLSPRA